jgi:hypothetical protein
MARFYVDYKTEQWDLYEWLKSRPWIKNEKSAAFMAGYVLGILQEITNVWESGLWQRRRAGTFRTYWERQEITREITELFFRNGEGFIDTIVVSTPEIAWRYNWRGKKVYVRDGVSFTVKTK